MRKVVSVLFCFLCLTLFAGLILMDKDNIQFIYAQEWLGLVPENYESAIVIEHIDGDTFKVNIDSKAESVRLIGVNTPETVHPSKPVEKFGKAASLFTKKLIGIGEYVHMVYDWNPRDLYDRLLTYVWFKATWKNKSYWVLHNLVLIINGFGDAYTTYPFEERYMDIFREAARIARMHKIGLWGDWNEEQIIETLTENKYTPMLFLSQLPVISIVSVQNQQQTSNTAILETIVYITASGSKYHRAGCKYLSKSSIPIKLKDAIARGYTPCSVCNPPVP